MPRYGTLLWLVALVAAAVPASTGRMFPKLEDWWTVYDIVTKHPLDNIQMTTERLGHVATMFMRNLCDKCNTSESLRAAKELCDVDAEPCGITWKWRWLEGEPRIFKHSYVVVDSSGHNSTNQFHWTSAGLDLLHGQPLGWDIASFVPHPQSPFSCCDIGLAIVNASVRGPYNVATYN